MLICDQGMIWLRGQEDPASEEVKLVGSRDARNRRICLLGVRFPLVMKQETAAALPCGNPEMKVLKGCLQAGALTQCLAETPDAGA